MPPLRLVLSPLIASVLLVALLTGCGGTGSGPASAGAASEGVGKLRVVAAEDFWGSIAEQLGGDKVEVTSIITNPAADPHDYEATSEDAKTMAGAEMSIVNGIGYDEWASELLAASPSSDRTELNVGELVGLSNGDNPHQWYSEESVHKVIDQIVADYKEALPTDDSYFDERKEAFEGEGLAEYEELIEEIRSRYKGTPVGASESIFEPMAATLELNLITPKGFMDAVNEGSEPTPRDKATAEEQVADGQVKVWVYDSQNAIPDVKRLNEAAEAAGIPVPAVTETLTPEGASFQEWMVRELKGLRSALARAGSG